MDALNFEEYRWIVVWGGICCGIVAFGIGANDVANAFATSVGAKSLTLKQAVIIAGIFEFAGAVLMGSRVTDTVRKGITSEELFNENEATLSLLMIGMCCTIMAVAIWLLVATALEMPVSTTHSCIGGIIGFALTAKGTAAVNWEKVQQVIMSWFLSPVLSGVIAALLFWLVRHFVLRSKNPVERAYTFYPILIAATMVINTFFIVYKGSPALGLKDTPLGVGIGVSFGVGIAFAILLRLIAVPFMRKRVDKLFNDRAAAAAADEEESSAGMLEGELTLGGDGGRTQSYLEVVGGECEPEDGPKTPSSGDVLINGRDDPVDPDVVRMRLKQARSKASNIGVVNVDAVAANFEKVQAIHDNAEKFDPKAEAVFTYLQIFTAMLDAFSHGANDVANAIGPFAAIWAIYETTSIDALAEKVDVPIWILAIGGGGIVLGLGLYGYKIITAIGVKLTKITPSRGFAIELGAALVICAGSYMELPLSTTHCQVGATIGVGLFEGLGSCGCGGSDGSGGVNWKKFGVVAFGWVITLVVVGTLSSLFFSFAVYSPSMKYADAYTLQLNSSQFSGSGLEL